MLTLTEIPAELDPEELHFKAISVIADGILPGELRSRTAGTPREGAGKQIADEAEYLAARGVTRRVARRAVEECSRWYVRRVARAFVDWKGPAAVGFLRGIADSPDTVMRRSYTEFAEVAEQLLTERGAEPSA